ncbi:MAG: c-type cytochrome, partial [Verrucomicrobia bacterium]|nr:c-type cytochrome [Verrucomicrobiota bacterium]
FMNFCSSCHRLDQEGHALGPDLYGIRNQAKESILLHIVDPNREIASGFEGVEWTTKSDEIYIGLLAFDHGGQLGLKLPSGIDLTFERNEGGTVRNLQLSFMPEGILDGLTTQQAADLLAYLRGE